MTTVVLPRENRESLYDVPETVKSELNIVFADSIDRVLETALTASPHAVEPILTIPSVEGVHGTIRH